MVKYKWNMFYGVWMITNVWFAKMTFKVKYIQNQAVMVCNENSYYVFDGRYLNIRGNKKLGIFGFAVE